MAKIKFKRPYQTNYSNVHTNTTHLARELRGNKGFSASTRGAIRGAVVRVFMNEYKVAYIFDRKDMQLVYTIKKNLTGNLVVTEH